MAKIKTFTDKQLSRMTKDQMAILEGSRSKIKKSKFRPGEIIKEVKNQDVLSKGGSEAIEETNKVITLEDLQKEEDYQKEIELLFNSEYNKQLNEFIKDDSYFDDYKNIEIHDNSILVRIFKMDISDFDNNESVELEYSTITKKIIQKRVKSDYKIYPIVKVIDVGEGFECKYKAGDIGLVTRSEVVGQDLNPKYVDIFQYHAVKGMTPKIPDGLSKTIPNVEKNWGKYMFVRPFVATPDIEDRLTYLVPSFALKGRYKVR